MSPQIQIDDDVLEALKQQAVPFEDHEPNDVLRRLLLLAGDQPQSVTTMTPTPGRVRASETVLQQRTSKGSKRLKPAKRKRAPSSTLLPESAYRLPILRVLFGNGGRMPTSEAVVAAGELVKDKLLPADLEMLGKKPRWEGRVQFARLQLIKDGLMKKGSPRGVWEITDAGEQKVKERLKADEIEATRTERALAGAL